MLQEVHAAMFVLCERVFLFLRQKVVVVYTQDMYGIVPNVRRGSWMMALPVNRQLLVMLGGAWAGVRWGDFARAVLD